MARPTPRPPPTATRTLYPLGRHCSLCGEMMWAAYHNFRTITTPAERAGAGFLAVFAEFARDVSREQTKAGMTDARKRGKAHSRPHAKANDAAQIRTLAQHGLSQAAIARHLGLWRTSVRWVLAQQEGP